MLKLLETNISSDIIIYDQPDKIKSPLIRKNLLIEHFNDNKLTEWVQSFKQTIKPDIFIEYMISTNRSDKTQGTYHQYMPYLHAHYDVAIDNFGFPLYSELDSSIKDKIKYSRSEYLFFFALQHFIGQDSYFKNKITMKYQFELEKKKFDAYIPELKILIEFQEDAKNHDNSESDTHKRLIAKMNGYYIMYFQEEELKKSDKNLRIYFENTFKKILYGAISYYKKEETMPLVRKLYIDKLRQDKIKIQGMVINNKSERIKIIDQSIKSFEGNEAMEKLMEKYVKNTLENITHFLTLDDIYKIYPDLMQDEDFQKEIDNLRYTRVQRNSEYYYEWSFLNYVIAQYSYNTSDRANYIKFLTELDQVYKILLEYNNEYLNKCRITKEEYDEYTIKNESTIITYYKDKLDKSKKKQELYKASLEAITNKFKVSPFIWSIRKIITNPFNGIFKKKIKDAITSIQPDIDVISDILELIKNKPKKQYSCQKIIGKSIIKELDDFPYVYYPDSDGIVYNEIYTFMKSLDISQDNIFFIMNQLCEFFNHEKTEIVNKIIHIDTYNLLIEVEPIESNQNIVKEESKEDEEKKEDSDSDSIGDLLS
jgi:hypothetical protein